MTAELSYSDWPLWAPDGRSIAFEGQDADGSSEIYVVSADGEELDRLTGDGLNRSPMWSPGGGWIAFIHDGEIEVIGADGENRHSLLRR